MTLEIPEAAKKLIHRYENLELGGKHIVAPYFINIKKAKDLRAMVGKGTPEEIEMEAKIWEKLKGINFEEMSEKEIKQFLIDRWLGIDCSGFIMHVLNEWHKVETGKSIWSKMKTNRPSFLRRLAYFLKPVENISANTISNEENAFKVQINSVLPGDVIRSKWKRKNSHHILLVSKVHREADGDVKEIEYVNSTEQYGEKNGVRHGKIAITHPNKPLASQHWVDEDEHGVNHTFEGFEFEVKDNGLRRLHAMDEIINSKYNS